MIRLLAAAVCALLALPVRASEAAPSASAATAYERGVEAFKARNFADAIREFNKAYRIDPNPVLVFNMARAFEELKEYASAIEYYRRYLEMSPRAEDRATVEQSIRGLELLMKSATPAMVSLSVTSKPDGARVFVDGREAGLTPYKGEVPAGRHFIAVERDGFTRQSVELAFAAPDAVEHVVTLVPTVAGAIGSNDRTWAYVALGTGAALFAASGLTGYQALKKSRKLNDIDEDPASADEEDYNDLKSSGRTFALVTDGLLLLGTAATVTGAVLFFSADEGPETSSRVVTGWRLAPAGLALTFE